MGMSKAWLPWFDGWALVDTGRALEEGGRTVLLVKAAGQSLPPTEREWRIVDDESPDRGPLAALATAYRALDDGACIGAIVAACDQEAQALRQALAALIGSNPPADRIRVLHDGERRQPFPGYYPLSALRSMQALGEQGIASMHAFLDADPSNVETVRVRTPFPDWDDPEAYLKAARLKGFEPPAWCREALGRRR